MRAGTGSAEAATGGGWFPDPTRRYALRWHDGSAWSEHVVEDSVRTLDPEGAPAEGLPGPRPGDDRWLPPPALPDVPRWGPFALGVPTGGPASVPPGGYEPVLTGNRALDLTQNYVNEFESGLRRDASLVESTVAALRAVPALKRLGVVLGALVLAATLLLGVAVYLVSDAAFDAGPGGAGLLFLVVPLLVVGLALVSVPSSVAAFAGAAAAGLAAIAGTRRSVAGLLTDAWRARGALGALTIARFARSRPGAAGKGAASLYEAFAVFAVPVSLAEGATLADAQRRSEELVAERWGPGRFRALGLPQTNPWSVVYSRGVVRYGYKAPYLAALAFLLVLLGPLLVALAIGEPGVIVGAFAWMWLSLVLSGVLWWAVAQPLLQGLLRAHLYHYATTGEAAAPFDADALHACLREEARAGLGLAQRGPRRGHPPPIGVGGVVKAFAADPAGYVKAESGLQPADIRAVIADARQLYKDGKLVTRALRTAGADGATAGALLATTRLPRDRCRLAVVNGIWTGKLKAHVDPDGTTRFTIA